MAFYSIVVSVCVGACVGACLSACVRSWTPVYVCVRAHSCECIHDVSLCARAYHCVHGHVQRRLLSCLGFCERSCLLGAFVRACLDAHTDTCVYLRIRVRTDVRTAPRDRFSSFGQVNFSFLLQFILVCHEVVYDTISYRGVYSLVPYGDGMK